jgi:hypothetical protein
MRVALSVGVASRPGRFVCDAHHVFELFSGLARPMDDRITMRIATLPRRNSMHVLKFAAVAVMVAAGASAGYSPAEAASPKCKPSVGTAHKFVCTTDMTAKPQTPQRSGGASIHQLKPAKFKAKTIPCYKSPVPGCS